MKLTAILFAGVIIISAATSCKKEGGNNNNNNGGDHHTNPPTPVTDVYAAGFENTSNPIASYWKNSAVTHLSSDTKGAATGIAVSGSDVYVVGYSVMPAGNTVAAYWKNGVRTYLTETTKNSEASAIVVSGSDVYIAGYTGDITGPTSKQAVAVYWKNGVQITLGDAASATISSFARAIAVQGSDVYVAGNVTGPTGFAATYWKNGTAVTLSGSKPEYSSQLFGISIYGNDIYATGQVYGTLTAGDIPRFAATYWKNGVPVTFATTTATEAIGTVVQNNDVYIIGTLNPTSNTTLAGYWKNGAFTGIGPSGSNPPSSLATSFCLSGSDIYVGGNIGGFTPCYWKNGALVQIPGSSGSIFAITVVTK
ncbi:MAG TPA: hypothetical protein VIM55_11200 [Mucilaginibacter sp.]